jgi:hypothetical protein
LTGSLLMGDPANSGNSANSAKHVRLSEPTVLRSAAGKLAEVRTGT